MAFSARLSAKNSLSLICATLSSRFQKFPKLPSVTQQNPMGLSSINCGKNLGVGLLAVESKKRVFFPRARDSKPREDLSVTTTPKRSKVRKDDFQSRSRQRYLKLKLPAKLSKNSCSAIGSSIRLPSTLKFIPLSAHHLDSSGNTRLVCSKRLVLAWDRHVEMKSNPSSKSSLPSGTWLLFRLPVEIISGFEESCGQAA